jgi:hypothetical protein
MFVGHLAVALGAKRVVPRASLGTLVAATFGLDLLWPIFLLLGLETVQIDPGNTAFTPLDFTSYPWSHSLVMAIVWGALFGLAVSSRMKTARTGLVVGAVVVSHWVLDVATHRPDMPLWPGGPLLGLGLWNSVPGTLVVEGALFAAAIALYVGQTRPRDGVGRWALAGLLLLTGLIWISGPWSPPPPSATAIGVVGVAMWLFVPWAAWIDRHRQSQF